MSPTVQSVGGGLGDVGAGVAAVVPRPASEATNFIDLSCRERHVQLRLRLGPNGAKLLDGVGGNRTEVVPFDTDAVLFESHPPYRQQVDLLLDGWQARRSVEADLHGLYVIARALPGEAYPPTVRLGGNARRTDLPWRVDALDVDEAAAHTGPGGVLMRVPVALTLIQDNRPSYALPASPSKKAKKKGRAKKGKKGSSSGGGRMIAVRGNADLVNIGKEHGIPWQRIADANGIRDPRAVREGQMIRLP